MTRIMMKIWSPNFRKDIIKLRKVQKSNWNSALCWWNYGNTASHTLLVEPWICITYTRKTWQCLLKERRKERRTGKKKGKSPSQFTRVFGNASWGAVWGINKDFWTHQMLNLLSNMAGGKTILFLYSFSFQALPHFLVTINVLNHKVCL